MLPTRRICALLISTLATGALFADGGYGAGLQTSFDLGLKGAIVPRLDYLHTSDSDSMSGVSLSTHSDIVSVGADYDYFLGADPDHGFYLLGGAGVAFANIQVSASAAGQSASTRSHQTLLYPELGAGYLFNRHVGLEVLYKDLNFSDVNLVVDNIPTGYSFSGGLQAALILRF